MKVELQVKQLDFNLLSTEQGQLCQAERILPANKQKPAGYTTDQQQNDRFFLIIMNNSSGIGSIIIHPFLPAAIRILYITVIMIKYHEQLINHRART